MMKSVTGHMTDEMTLKQYHQPSQEEINAAVFEVFEINIDDFKIDQSKSEGTKEPELYCFEDFVPKKTNKSASPTSSSQPLSQFVRSVSHSPVPSQLSSHSENVLINCRVENAKKELHRSKTLPIIRPPKVVQNESLSPSIDVERTRLNRKQSVPILNILKRGKSSNDFLSNGASSGTSSQYYRSKSCERRRSTAIGKQSPSNRDMLSRKSRTKMQDLRRVSSWKPKKEKRLSILSRSKSDGGNAESLPPELRLPGPGPPMIPRSAWNFDDDTDSTTSSETMTTGSDDVSVHKAPMPMYYTTPPKANMTRSSDDKKASKRPVSHNSDPSLNSRQRSVSLDCGDGRMMKMFTSESDNLQLLQTGTGNHQTLRASPSDPGNLLRSNGYLTPGRSSKNSLTTPNKKRSSISSTDTDSSTPGKLERKRTSKELKTYDIIALFDAVEHQDLDAVKDILETNGLDINSVNSEFLTPLDVAVMTNNIPMAKMLLFHGARESPLFQRGEGRSARLDILVSEAERRVVDLTATVLNGNSAISSNQQKENERQLSHWQFRHRLLKRMKAGYDHARSPDPPTNVSLNISSSTSLLVRFGEPLNRNGAVVTKYKVEWSKDESFTPVEGEIILDEVRYLEVEIKHLKKGQPYYVRVSAMNMKGFSSPALSNPAYAVPSSWRDADKVQPRSHGKLKILEELFTQVKTLRPADAPTIKDSPGMSSPVRRKKGFKNLFSSSPKFHKTLKRGVYLACYFRYEDKVLVTSEEQVPIVEVDETYAGLSLHLDIYWLMKVACTWEDVKSLRQDMERSTAEGKVHFRGKLLQAVSVLQTALGTHDLGQFYYKPLRDPNGSVVLATVNFIRDPKVVSFNSGKWIPVSRLQRRQSSTYGEFPEEQDCIVSSLYDLTVYNQTSSVPLRPGLYLGYLKLHVSVDLIRVLVSQSAPNVLPNVKVRDCSNVSVEEWKWLKGISPDSQKSLTMSNNQQMFHNCLSKASAKLFKMLGIAEESSLLHRVYDYEVIELSPNVSFILMLPSADELCIVPGQSDDFMEREEFTLLPVQVFDIIHMCTYQQQFISRYSRLSSILEMDTILAQQMQREAFSKEELNTAKDRVQQLLNLQNDLDKTWKGMRWIMDIITHARSRTFCGCIPVKTLYSAVDENTLSMEFEQKSKVIDNNNHPNFHLSSCDSNEISVGKDNRKIAKFYDPNEELLSDNGQLDTQSDSAPSHSDNSGILRVYAAYETGLAKGTSVKLHVTPRTTAREVINLVVLNLNQAVINKGKIGPVYDEEQFKEFCLVAVIGARERILRDDYQPLQLQNPWTKGRLYVRMRSNLLAAIQQGHGTAV